MGKKEIKMSLTRCDECGKGISPGQGHYRIEGEDSYFCSDECLTVSFDKSHGEGSLRQDEFDDDEKVNEAGGYYSVLEDGKWIPIPLCWTTMEEEEGQ
jgi:YHS domain-containing protein